MTRMTRILADFFKMLRVVLSKLYHKGSKTNEKAQDFFMPLSFNSIIHPRKSASSAEIRVLFGIL